LARWIALWHDMDCGFGELLKEEREGFLDAVGDDDAYW
jgi:hypothetical protein